MEVKVIIKSKELSWENLQALIQGIRSCEQNSFPDKRLIIWIDAVGLTEAEMSEILSSVKPPY